MFRSFESLPRCISDESGGVSDRFFMAAPTDPREPEKVAPLLNTLMEPSPEDPCSPPPTSLLGVATIPSNAPRRKHPTADQMLAKVLLYSGDEIFQKFIEELQINVTPASVEAKRVRQMQVLMSLR